MKIYNRFYLSLLGITLVSSWLSAGGNIEPTYENIDIVESEDFGNSSVGVFAGSKGLGVEYSKKLGTVPNGVIKFSISGLSGVQFCLDDNGVSYDSDVTLLNLGGTFDYHPFNNGFFLSAGGFYNGNSVDFKVTPAEDGSYTLDGVHYKAGDVDYIEGKTDFNSFVPYVGVGYDNSLFSSGNWFFTARAGVIYQGSSNIELDYKCGELATNDVCNQLEQSVARVQDSLNDEVDKYQLHPDLSIGIAYKF